MQYSVSDFIFEDGDWSFAESSEELWANTLLSSDEGQAMISAYKKFKPVLQFLHKECEKDNSPFNAVKDYLVGVMNGLAPKYRILVADGAAWRDVGEGPFSSLEGAVDFAKAEVGVCWVVALGGEPVAISEGIKWFRWE